MKGKQTHEPYLLRCESSDQCVGEICLRAPRIGKAGNGIGVASVRQYTHPASRLAPARGCVKTRIHSFLKTKKRFKSLSPKIKKRPEPNESVDFFAHHPRAEFSHSLAHR
jgi:hypothetical protein